MYDEGEEEDEEEDDGGGGGDGIRFDGSSWVLLNCRATPSGE